MKQAPQLLWRKLPRSAGYANHRDWRIVLSCLVLLEKSQVYETLIHEYAHLLAIDRFGVAGAGHGEHWKACMRELGQNPKRTHNYETVTVNRQVVVYQCKTCGKFIERKRRLPRGKTWLHKACNGRLIHVETRRPSEERK